MSDVSEAWELDADWFRENFPLAATKSETAAFCDRVGEKMSQGISRSRARFEAVCEMKRQRHAQD